MTQFMTQLNFDNQVSILPSVLDATQRALHRHLRRSHQRRHRRQLVDARHRRRQSLQDQPKVILSFTLSMHDKLVLSIAANLGIKVLLVCERPISRTHCREDRKKPSYLAGFEPATLLRVLYYCSTCNRCTG